MKDKKNFQKSNREGDFETFVVNEMTAVLRALLLLSKLPKLIWSYLATKGFKNAQTSPKC